MSINFTVFIVGGKEKMVLYCFTEGGLLNRIDYSLIQSFPPHAGVFFPVSVDKREFKHCRGLKFVFSDLVVLVQILNREPMLKGTVRFFFFFFGRGVG